MSFKALLMRELVRWTAKRRLRNSEDVLALRAELDGLKQGRPARSWPLAITRFAMEGVEVEHVAAKGVTAPEQDPAALLYLHGGAWVVGAPDDFRPLTVRLAQLTGVSVYAPDYRLAPEHRYPAALDDCEAVYRALLAKGIDASRIAVLGDSAGGNLVLALALRLKRKGLPQPAALVGLSACTDLTGSSHSFKRNARRDALLPAERLHDCIEAYCPRRSVTEAEISPLYGDPAGLAPVLLQVSNNEILLDDSVRFAQRVQEAGGDARLEVWKGLWHVWQNFPGRVPEADQAIEQIVAFLREHLAPVAVPPGHERG